MSTDWLSAGVVLLAGLAMGLWVVRRALVEKKRGASAPLERRDLLGKRDVLYAQIRELDELAAKRSPDQLARERYALELEAARVLQRLDSLPAEATPPPAPLRSEGVPAGKPALRGFLWGTGSMAAVALLLYMVAGAARPREAEPARPSPAADPDVARARAAILRDPEDIEARLALARVLLARQDMMGVFNETKYVLERRPGDPRALSYQSLVRLAMGQADVALEMLKKAVAAAPDQFDAYVHMALVYAQMGRKKDSARVMSEAKKRFPDQASVLARLESEIAKASPDEASVSVEAHANVPPPTAGGGSASVAGVLDVAPGLAAELPRGAVVFVTLREAGFGAGPPTAAKRLVAISFPLRFEIGAGDSMTGEALPAKVLVEARVDLDGDPMTRSPSDPRARLDDIPLGRTDLRLVLGR